jgi:hypothetical protein
MLQTMDWLNFPKGRDRNDPMSGVSDSKSSLPMMRIGLSPSPSRAGGPSLGLRIHSWTFS